MRQKKFSSPRDQTRINHHIKIPSIRVIGPDGDQLGIMSPDEARRIASDYDLDLVEVAPTARPPVCRIMDFGKFRYEQSKKNSASQAKKTQLKTLLFRPKTDSHDLHTKVKKGLDMLEKGNTVKLVMRMRGREQSGALQGRWLEKMQEIITEFGDKANVIATPKREGRTISATLEPTATA